MRPSVRVELAGRSDLAQIAEIEHRAFRPAWDRDTLAIWLNSPSSRAWLARLGSEGVGYGLLLLLGQEAELLRLAVLPEHQGQGIGGAILRSIVAWADATGIERLFLEVRRSNQRALVLYQRYGFFVSGVRPRYYENGEDAWLLARSLNPLGTA